ncbi:MAG: hypothetical protein ACJAS2_000492 [Pseudohongiellaceae bacterium]
MLGETSLKKNIRRNIDLALTAVGIAVVVSAIILGTSLGVRAQVPIALIGILLMEAGRWGLSAKFVPNQRRYTSLRDEGDRMLDLIRELNCAAIAKEIGTEDAKRFQLTLEAMHSSVLKMSELASVEAGRASESAPPG